MKSKALTDIQVLLVDDEISACTNLSTILGKYIEPAIKNIRIAYSTSEAEKFIAQQHPNVLFLDVEMPGENGFEFLSRIAPFSFEVVFVTAYEKYAIRAFKLNAIDYILKPIDITEVETAVKKIIERIVFKKLIRETNDHNFLPQQINNLQTQAITLKNNNSLEIVDFQNILFIEAQGSYSLFYYLRQNVEQNILMSNCIAEYEELLPSNTFFRIHKSYLVNRNHIDKIITSANPHLLIRGHELSIGRRRLPLLKKFLKYQSV